MEELKPCPFCGGEAELRDDGETGYPFSVQCIECGGMTCGHLHADTPFGAIAAWNARADYHGYEQAAIEAWESIKAWNARATHGTLTAEQVREAWCGNLKRDCIYDPPTPDWQAIADELNEALGKPQAWRTSWEQERYDRWYNSLFHGEPSSFRELVEDIIWTAHTVDLGPNGNTYQGVDEGEVNTDGLIESWAKKAATLGDGECEYVWDEQEGTFHCSSCGTLLTNEIDIEWPSHKVTPITLPNYCPNCGRKVKR